jgi:glycosyltransferase involved in cell wall biosynthesis
MSGIYPPEIGGPALFIPNLAKYLLKSKHYCEVLTIRNDSSFHEEEGWKVKFIKRSKLPVRMVKVVTRLLRDRNDFNLYFANGLVEEVGIFLFLTRKKGVAKVVGDAVWERARNKGETFASVTDFNLHRGTPVQRLQRTLLVFALNQFELVICPSFELKRIVSSWGVTTPVVVIQNGVGLPENIHSCYRDIDVVTVSRLVNWKNIEYVVKACQQIGASLWIVGEGPEKENLVHSAKEKDTEIFFAGNVENQKIPSILERSKLFVLYSDYEGLSFALLEAMAHGAVPVVSNCEGNSSVVVNGENGCIVPLKNLEILTQSIESLLLNDNLRKKMADESYKLVNAKYNLESRLSEYLKLFESVV